MQKNSKYRLGTRGSQLAMIQAETISRIVGDCEIVKIVSEGDKVKGPLRDHGGKGLFTSALENALLNSDIDFAVHSAKDVPTDIPDEFQLFFVTPRQDTDDVFISKDGLRFCDLKSGSKIGTCSLRRQNQLLNKRTDLEILPIRGNIETRIKKVIDGQFDATVLAKAGLLRSGLYEKHKDMITEIDLIPAGGQGALAIEVLSANKELCELFDKLKDPQTHNAVSAERHVLSQLNVDCHSSIAIHITQSGQKATAMTSNPDGTNYYEFSVVAADYTQTAEKLLNQILNKNK